MARRTRHVEVSTVVSVDAISRADAERVTTLLTAALGGHPGGDGPARVQSVYDEERARLRLVLLGGAATTAELLRLVDALLES